MLPAAIERQLRSLAEECRLVRSSLGDLDDELAGWTRRAHEARLRSLLSETPQAAADYRMAVRAVAVTRTGRDARAEQLAGIEQQVDALLDLLVERTGAGTAPHATMVASARGAV
ncbi:MAG: hypothetical protein ACK5RL_13695 [Acidimicrobiales bacterium]